MTEMPKYGKDYEYLQWVSKRSSDTFRYSYDLFSAYKDVFIPLGLKTGHSLLDVGSCNGRFGQYLSHPGVKTTGIEINFAAITQGRMDYPNNRMHAVNGDAAHLPFGEKTFDRLMSYDVLEHIPEPYLELVFSEMSRVLLAPIMFHKITTTEDVQNIDKDPTHVTKWSTNKWIEWFQSHGWQTVGPTTRKNLKLKTLYGNFLIKKS